VGGNVKTDFFSVKDFRRQFAAQGCDANSLVGDAQFVNAAAGDE